MKIIIIILTLISMNIFANEAGRKAGIGETITVPGDDGVCRDITNNNCQKGGVNREVMVPLKRTSELTTNLAIKPACVEVVDCPTGGSCYQDSDGDGYGNVAVTGTCGPGYVADSTDCCDTDSNAYPGSGWADDDQRVGCGGYDFNCDGSDTAVNLGANVFLRLGAHATASYTQTPGPTCNPSTEVIYNRASTTTATCGVNYTLCINNPGIAFGTGTGIGTSCQDLFQNLDATYCITGGGNTIVPCQ